MDTTRSLKPTMILLYAYVGFETMVVPAGEMSNPEASGSALVLVYCDFSECSGVYLLYIVATGTYAQLAGTKNPVALAAGEFLGSFGGTLILVGIALSVSARMLVQHLSSTAFLRACRERGSASDCWTSFSTHARSCTQLFSRGGLRCP